MTGITARLDRRFFIILLTGALLAPVALLSMAVPANAASPFTVNGTADTHDANQGDGICADASGKCTLRAAAEETNNGAPGGQINVPAGTYLISLGAINVQNGQSIVGSGSPGPVIDGSGNPGYVDVFSTQSSDPITFDGLQFVNSGDGTIDQAVIDQGGQSLTVKNSTFTGNRGRGIWGESGTTAVVNSTFYGNAGLAVDAENNELDLTNVTIDGNGQPNSPDGGGVGVYALSNNIRDSIISNNQPSNCPNTVGFPVSGDHSLDADGSCGFVDSGNISGNPILGPLAYNGGPSDRAQTQALQSGSPAIDAGNNASCASTDERGVTRPQDGNGDSVAVCDMGAYELQASTGAALNPGSTTCNGVYGGSGKDVVVRSGASCTLIPGTHVSHDVEVQKGGTLSAQGITVGHDLKADKAAGVTVCGTLVGHDLDVQNGASVVIGDAANGCPGNHVGRDLTVKTNAGKVVVGENTIGNDLRVEDNKPGGTTVRGNAAGHDASCNKNDPQTGGGNTAGHKNTCPS
jgi:CSLREA domain-containing protein